MMKKIFEEENFDCKVKLPLWRITEDVLLPYCIKNYIFSQFFFEKDHLLPRNKDKEVVLIFTNDKKRNVIGTLCDIVDFNTSSENAYSVTLQGVKRVNAEILKGSTRLFAKIEEIKEKYFPKNDIEVKAKIRTILKKVELLEQISRDRIVSVSDLKKITDISRLTDVIASLINLSFDEKIKLLYETSSIKRIDLLLNILTKEIQIESFKEELNEKTALDIDKKQREYFLRQQIETLEQELNPDKDFYGSEGYYRKLLEKIPLSQNAKEVVEKEIKSLSHHTTFSEEAAQIKSYLDIVFDLPWETYTDDEEDIAKVRRMLEKRHYGLKKAKTRILEYLAVKKIGGKGRAKVFCFVGPPGVGKTSLARAISDSLKRKFVEMSLGGIKDEAEIRGHRKTYIGAMPGRIINCLRSAKSLNPVFLLDEIDKLGYDYKGDPTSALLEALDPEQNSRFVDNFLGFPFDLSKVLFITTANSLDGIPSPLLDRLEVIEFPSFSEDEKVKVAKRHIIPKIAKETNLEEIEFEDKAILKIVRDYTRESGVRNLEREIERIFRKFALKKAQGRKFEKLVRENDIQKIVGPPPFFEWFTLNEKKVGVATGLAYTEFGGELLFCETKIIDGSGNLILTGQIGEIMKESAQASLTLVKSLLKDFGIDNDLSKKDIHIHFPEGAIPKDGPSAGITIVVSLFSAVTNQKVRRNLGFTGEINLSGEIIPVGGIREKLLAASRAKIQEVIIPEKNRVKAMEVKRKDAKNLKITTFQNVREVLEYVFKDEMPSDSSFRRNLKRQKVVRVKGSRSS